MPYTEPVDLATLSPPAIAANLRASVTRAERQLSAMSLRRAARPLAPGKWSTQETVGHLIDSCFNNHQRLIRLQLAPKLIFPGYQQVEWVALNHYVLLPWPEVLALFLTLNRHFAHAIQHADAARFSHVWHHEGEQITLGFMLVDYIAHLEHHLSQLPGYVSLLPK